MNLKILKKVKVKIYLKIKSISKIKKYILTISIWLRPSSKDDQN